MKRIRVLGETTVTVSCLVTVPDLCDNSEEIFRKAKRRFGGIHAYGGNGGDMKLIGVEKTEETIAADEPVAWTDWMEE